MNDAASLRTETGVAELASKVRADFASDLGLAVGKFPQLRDDDAADDYFLALAAADHVQSARRRFAGHPDIRRERSAKQALDLVRLWAMDQ